MNKHTVRERLMASTMIGGATLLAFSAAPAFAQQAPAPAAAPAASTVQEVVVTGSRIPHPGLTSVSPLTTVGAQDIKLQGVQNVEDLINSLPQAFADFGAMESNGATGTATVNLRNLGDKRTL
ncbi:MAG TPA: TonB-dependent receptor, partial [Caulobacteraceae bacterium]|nr:TonB-dependent receptor [Caulobacteraceae bacterium]